MKLYVIVLSAGRTGHVPGACTIAVHALVEMLRIPGRQPDTMMIMIYDDDDGGGGDDDDDEEEEEKDDDFALEFAIGDQLIIFWNECFALVTPTFPSEVTMASGWIMYCELSIRDHPHMTLFQLFSGQWIITSLLYNSAW